MSLTTTDIAVRPAQQPGLLRSLNAFLIGRATTRRTIRELSELRARDLADLGISSHDIPRLARDAAKTAMAKYLAA